MKLSFEYKGIKVTYYLTYKKAKAISINVAEDGTVNVVAPRGTSVFSVMDKVKGNAPWIIRELLSKSKVEIEPKIFEQYTYLGKNYKLELNVNSEAPKATVKMARGKFMVETPEDSPRLIRNAIVEWYKQKVMVKVKERLKEYNDFFEIKPENIEVVDDETLLLKGNDKEFVIGVKTGALPAEVIDYIIVDSLCRINHTDDAKAEARLAEVLPNFEKSRQWLEVNKNNIVL